MNFKEAEQRFRFLEDQLARNVITMEQYQAELQQIRITDAQGRLWMLQERTGQWFVQERGQWRAATIDEASQQPATTPPPPPPPGPQSVQSKDPRQRARDDKKGGGCGKTLRYLVLWAVAWIIIGGIVFIFWGQDEPGAVLGVGLAAVISLVLMLASLVTGWSGTVIDVRVENVSTTDDEGYTHTQQVRYAYVRRDNGKVKKVHALPQWQVGDYLIKKRGESQVLHYPAQE